MSYNLICGFLVVAGTVTLLLTGLVLLARFVDSARPGSERSWAAWNRPDAATAIG